MILMVASGGLALVSPRPFPRNGYIDFSRPDRLDVAL